MTENRFDSWIHGTFRADPTGLALYRIAYAAFALFVVAPGHDVYTDLVALASLPDAMFAPPPGPMAIFDGFPSEIAAHTILVLLNVALAGLLLGVRTRAMSITTGILFLLVYGFSYSLGKINHNILFVAVPFVMAFSGWGAALSYDARRGGKRTVAAWPIMLLAAIVGFAMFTAGFAKVLGGWLDPTTHASYGHLLKHYFVRGRTDLAAPFAIGAESGVLWEVFDYATVLFELSFVVALTKARTIRLFAALAVVFHFGIMIVLNISFHFNLIVYAAFADWNTMGRMVRDRLPEPGTRSVPRGVLLAGALVLGLTFYAAGSPLVLLDRAVALRSDLLAREVLVMIAAMSLVVYVGIRDGILWLHRLTSTVRRPVPV